LNSQNFFKTFLLVALLFCLSINAQEFKGIHSSNYFPLQNIYNQPADLVRSDKRWHINILSADLYMAKDLKFGEDNFFDMALKGKWDDLNYFFNAEKLELIIVGEAKLPSVSYKINAKNALAFSIKLPAQGLYKTSNSQLFDFFQNLDHPEDGDLENEFFKGIINQWTEFTLSWSGLLWQKKGNLLTAGINLNYLVGGGAGYFDLDGIDILYGADKLDFFDVEVSYAVNDALVETIDSGNFDLFGDRGIGVDIGFSYSYRPEDRLDIPYRFKVGFVANNLGHLKYTSNVESGTFRVTANDVPYEVFEDVETIPELIETLKDLVDFTETKNDAFTMDLPATYAITGDYCFENNWYLSSYLSLQPKLFGNVRNISIKDQWGFGLTPRFENKNWGVFLPIFHNTTNNSIGLAFKYKFFFLGSRTIIGNLFSNEKGNGTLYFGFNIPFGKELKI